MEGSRSPFCPLLERSLQTPFCSAAHPQPSPVTHRNQMLHYFLTIIIGLSKLRIFTWMFQLANLFPPSPFFHKYTNIRCMHYVLTPIEKRELTGLWSLVFSSMWLRYLTCLTLLPLHRILSHQAGTRHFPLQETATVLEEKYERENKISKYFPADSVLVWWRGQKRFP